MEQNTVIRFYDLPNPGENKDRRNREIERMRKRVSSSDRFFIDKPNLRTASEKKLRDWVVNSMREGEVLKVRRIENFATSLKDMIKLAEIMEKNGASLEVTYGPGQKVWKVARELGKVVEVFQARQTSFGRKARSRTHDTKMGKPRWKPNERAYKAYLYVINDMRNEGLSRSKVAEKLGYGKGTTLMYRQVRIIALERKDIFDPWNPKEFLRDVMNEKDFKYYSEIFTN